MYLLVISTCAAGAVVPLYVALTNIGVLREDSILATEKSIVIWLAAVITSTVAFMLIALVNSVLLLLGSRAWIGHGIVLLLCFALAVTRRYFWYPLWEDPLTTGEVRVLNVGTAVCLCSFVLGLCVINAERLR